MVDLSWLPDRHLGVAATLAHVDAVLAGIANLVFEEGATPGGPFGLTEEVTEDGSRTVVTSVRPLPREIALLAADAMTTMRAAIEHTLFAEAVYLTGRNLTEKEERAIEMPAHDTVETFDEWVSARKRRLPPALLEGQPLLARVRALQPYHRHSRPADHPLRVLAAHTNHAKHRQPAVAATRVGMAFISAGVGSAAAPAGRPVRVGDILATTPAGQRAILNFWPTIGFQRPHTDTWPQVMPELTWLADWTRTVAVPTLITGGHDVDPLPAWYDITTGHEDERAAITAGRWTTASDALANRFTVEHLRQSLASTLALAQSHPPVDVLERWVASLGDDELVRRGTSLTFTASPAEALANIERIDAMVRDALAWHDAQPAGE